MRIKKKLHTHVNFINKCDLIRGVVCKCLIIRVNKLILFKYLLIRFLSNIQPVNVLAMSRHVPAADPTSHRAYYENISVTIPLGIPSWKNTINTIDIKELHYHYITTGVGLSELHVSVGIGEKMTNIWGLAEAVYKSQTWRHGRGYV